MSLILLLFLCLFPLFLDRGDLVEYEPINFLLLLLFHIFKKLRNKKTLFSPSSLFVIYVCLNYTIGSLFYHKSIFDDYLNNLLDLRLILKRILINNLFLFFSIVFSNYFFVIKDVFSKRLNLRITNSPKKVFLYGFFLILFFSLVEFNLNFIGGKGSLSNIPTSIGAILLFLYSTKKKPPIKYILYTLVFFIMSYSSYDDKRVAILLVLTFLVIEYHLHFKIFKLKNFLQLLFVGSLSFILILTMSIKRGYGGFTTLDKSKNIFELLPYVPKYAKSELFLASLSNNLEISYSYIHSNRALDYAIKNNILLGGSTIFKSLFLFIPRSIYKEKPKSMIDRYTMSFSAQQRNDGVSWPVNLISEFFWNFSYIGCLFLAIFLLLFDSLFHNYVKSTDNNQIYKLVLPLFLLNQWIVLIRGSGLELFLLDFLIGSIFILPLLSVHKKKHATDF